MVVDDTVDDVSLAAMDDEVVGCAYGSFDSVVAGGGFTSQYAPAITASTTTAEVATRATPTHCTHACARAVSDIGGAGRSGISLNEAPNVGGRVGPIERLGEAKAEHIGPPINYDATRSESSSRTAVDTWRRATHAASISIGMRRYAPWWPLRRRRQSA